jgi:tetratricopeptide (TPR) repeat protein
MSSESTESVGLYQFLTWVEVNKNRLVKGALVVVVIGFAITFVRWKTHQTELLASDELLSLRTRLGAASATEGPDAKDFLAVAEKFSGTDAAERAELLAAGALFTSGDYTGAATAFETFAQRYPSHPMAASAAYGIGASLEAQSKTAEALKAYESVVSNYPTSSVADEAKFSLARIHEKSGRNEQAFKLYSELSNASSGFWSTEAGTRRDRLAADYPDLAAKAVVGSTNSPAISAPATSGQ